MHNLDRFLIDHDIAMLRTVARNRGVALDTNRQTEAAKQLAVALLDPLSVRVALARLSPEGCQALEALQAAGGQMRGPQFDRRFGPVRPVGPGRLQREEPWQDPASPAEELWYAGLIFRAFSQDEGGAGDFYFIPEDLLPLLPQPRQEAPVFAVEFVAAPARHSDDGPALIHDLFSYLVFLHTHDVRLYADGRLVRPGLASLSARLVDRDPRRLGFLRYLAEHLGFVTREGKSLRLQSTLAKRWLIASPARQLAVIQKAWRDDPAWRDLCQVPTLECDQETGWHLRYDPVAARARLLTQLASCPQEGWWSPASFVTAVKERDPDFLRPDGDYDSWYIRDAAGGQYLSGFESWDLVEGALIADLLTGPLRWLGIVAAVTDIADPACRLTGAGARFLGLVTDEPEAQPSPPIVVRPDFSVELPAPANLYTRFQLERFADLKKRAPCRYTLSASSLGRALARDIRVEQVLAFLQQAGESPVPANVAGQLRLWAGRFGQVQLEEMALLRVENERILREISVLPETRALLGQALSPTSVLVTKENLPRLRRALRALGFLPSPSDEPAESAP